MTKEDVIEKFCMIAMNVMEKRFHYSEAADCFCHCCNQRSFRDYHFSPHVLTFIEQAVNDALARRQFNGNPD